MKSKPTPKVELVVTRRTANIISFTAHSNDAKEFVVKNAPEFGSFHTDSNSLFVIVAPGYDFNEVAEYFESYNDEGE